MVFGAAVFRWFLFMWNIFHSKRLNIEIQLMKRLSGKHIIKYLKVIVMTLFLNSDTFSGRKDMFTIKTKSFSYPNCFSQIYLCVCKPCKLEHLMQFYCINSIWQIKRKRNVKLYKIIWFKRFKTFVLMNDQHGCQRLLKDVHKSYFTTVLWIRGLPMELKTLTFLHQFQNGFKWNIRTLTLSSKVDHRFILCDCHSSDIFS